MESGGHLGILLILGIGVLGGALGAWFFQKIRFPQVVGYIVFGILIGQSGFHVVRKEDIEKLQSFTWFALGVIGFLVGGELRAETFRRYGKQFLSILLWEGLLAFFLVALPVTGIVYFITGQWIAAAAAGIVLGAIASATDPASTVEVLWEYRAKGVLTSAIIAVIALDDALAMMLYGIGKSCAEMLAGQGGSVLSEMGKVGYELFGSLLVGLVFGGMMILFLRYAHQKKDRMLAIAAGLLLVLIGGAKAAGLDVILVTMAMGVLVVNFAPVRSEQLFGMVKSFSVPIYVLFFVLVGASLGIASMPWWLWSVVIVYVFGRNFGKIAGCWIGGRLSGAPKIVQNFAGLGLFAQGGVAIGLSIMASEHLGQIRINETLSLGELIIFCVTATTMIVQLAGPPMVKWSIRLADEIGRNVTEEDIIDRMLVEQAVHGGIEPLHETDPIRIVLQRFTMDEYTAYPVVNSEEKLIGVLTLGQLKDILIDSDCWEWMVAADVMESETEPIQGRTPLRKALETMEKANVKQLPVVLEQAGVCSFGMLDFSHVRKVVEQELIRVQAGL